MGLSYIVDKCWKYKNSKRTNIDDARMHDLAPIRTGERPYHKLMLYIALVDHYTISVAIDAHDSYRWPFPITLSLLFTSTLPALESR